MEAQHLAQTLEFLRALVLHAEVERHVCSLVVQVLELLVVLESIQDHLVGLPQIAKPRVQLPLGALADIRLHLCEYESAAPLSKSTRLSS